MKQIIFTFATILAGHTITLAQASFIAEYDPLYSFQTGIVDVSVAPDGEIAMLMADASISSKGRICRIDASGAILESSTYELNAGISFVSWDVNSEQEAFVVYKQGVQGSGVDHYIAKIDASGDVLWSQKVNMDIDFDGYAIHSVSASPDGGVYVNLRSAPQTSPTHRRQTVFLLDADGQVQWSYSTGVLGGSGSLWPMYSAVSSDGDFYSVSRLTDGTGSGQNIHLLRLSQTGSLIWEKTFGFSQFEEILDVQVDFDGNLYLLTGENGDAQIHKFSDAGSHIASREFFQMNDQDETTFFSRKLAIDAGEIYVLGNYSSNSFGNPAIAQLGDDLFVEAFTYANLSEYRYLAGGMVRNGKAYIGFGFFPFVGNGLVVLDLESPLGGCFETLGMSSEGTAIEITEADLTEEVAVAFELSEVFLERGSFESTFTPLCHPLGSDGFEEISLTAYPNPVTDGTFYLSGDVGLHNKAASLYSADGREWGTNPIGPNGRIEFPAGLPSGLYVLRVPGYSRGCRILVMTE